jgi:hypothetical protein
VRHTLPHIKPRVDTCGDGALDVATRVVQQHLVVSYVNADRWKAGEGAIQR